MEPGAILLPERTSFPARDDASFPSLQEGGRRHLSSVGGETLEGRLQEAALDADAKDASEPGARRGRSSRGCAAVREREGIGRITKVFESVYVFTVAREVISDGIAQIGS